MISDLIAVILADAGVTTQLGHRVRPIRRDQSDTLPAAAVNIISATPDVHMAGPSGYVATRVQVDVYGATWVSAEAAAQALDALLNGFAGIQGATVFQGVMLDNKSSGFEAGDTAADRMVRIRLDYMVHHGRTS